MGGQAPGSAYLQGQRPPLGLPGGQGIGAAMPVGFNPSMLSQYQQLVGGGLTPFMANRQPPQLGLLGTNNFNPAQYAGRPPLQITPQLQQQWAALDPATQQRLLQMYPQIGAALQGGGTAST